MQADDSLFFFDEDSGDVTFSWNEIGVLSVNHNNVNFETNFDEDDPGIITFIRLGKVNIKNEKYLKKGKWRINANKHGILKDGDVKRWRKRKKNNFYWVMFLMYQ